MTYTITHHAAGRIRLDVPAIRRTGRQTLQALSRAVSRLPVFHGIRGISVAAASGCIDIEYDPDLLDIEDYLIDMEAIVGMLAVCIERVPRESRPAA